MTNISLRGKVTLFLFFSLMTIGIMFAFSKQMWVLTGILIFIFFAGVFGFFELVHYLNKLEEENKDKRIVQLTYKELVKLKRDGYIEKNGERIENGNRGKEN